MDIGSRFHVFTLLAVIGVVWAIVSIGRRSAHPDRFGRWLGGGLLALWCAYNLYYLQPAVFAWERSLPLQVCDILAALAALMLLSPQPLARAAVALSAIPLASQAVLTPVGIHDPAALRFWLYWSLHAGILSAALYDIVVNGYRPARRDIGRVAMLDVLYIAVMLPVDIMFGWNYGYVAPAAIDGRTVVDVLGPWPWRVGVMLVLVFGLQLLMFLAISRLGSRTRRHAVELRVS